MATLMTIITAIFITVTPQTVESLIVNEPLIQDVECIVYSDTIVVALKTEPIFTRSERERLTSSIRNAIRNEYDVRELIITYDKDIYYRISRIEEMKNKGVDEEKVRKEIIYIINTARNRERAA